MDLRKFIGKENDIYNICGVIYPPKKYLIIKVCMQLGINFHFGKIRIWNFFLIYGKSELGI